MSQTLDHVEDLPDIPVDVTPEQYADILEGLSQASVDRHFDAFIDVPWSDPDFQVHHDDPRWVLPADVDPLGAHPWYQSQSLARQIEIGQWRQANILKVGLQFENILIRGIMQYVFTLPNGSPEYRYLTHEATEECHHTQMFQQTVNRIGVDVAGMPWLMRKVAGILPLAGSAVPFAFFIGVLAGEEPIDHTQKGILRSGKDLPPVLSRIMEIHVAEEARHISFAHHYIRRNASRLGRVEKFVISLLFPVIMRVLCDVIMVPSKAFRKEFGIPRKVMKDLYWRAPESRERLQELFGDVRMLADQSELRKNRMARWMWKLCRIDGRPSRYRSEPPVAFSQG
ncbi:AurF N-oxygenase family protein [Aeromicrobium ginsengisoli]|uniref:Diiron oxygenase n=1 Tax=Aeromicrobium ginsengisoli TaxID=363867 RepID=A0A5M4FGE1_9ACTN|nr:diiron oxygenase [Aeromicrobium ginsengisoli]KAA1399226.1 diiron oxygenase [Aeromicrobium ginsengisoli]